MPTGSYIGLDSVGALGPYFKAELDIDAGTIPLSELIGDLGILISLYSFPNLFMALIGGLVVDKIGYNRYSVLYLIPRANILFATITFVGKPG